MSNNITTSATTRATVVTTITTTPTTLLTSFNKQSVVLPGQKSTSSTIPLVTTFYTGASSVVAKTDTTANSKSTTSATTQQYNTETTNVITPELSNAIGHGANNDTNQTNKTITTPEPNYDAQNSSSNNITKTNNNNNNNNNNRTGFTTTQQALTTTSESSPVLGSPYKPDPRAYIKPKPGLIITFDYT